MSNSANSYRCSFCGDAVLSSDGVHSEEHPCFLCFDCIQNLYFFYTESVLPHRSGVLNSSQVSSLDNL